MAYRCRFAARSSFGRGTGASGFTLIEILVVISIIAILAALVIGGVGVIQRRAKESATKLEVKQFQEAVEKYLFDEGIYPASDKEANPEANYFPELYRALFGVPRPNGPGGRSAPYGNISGERTVVVDEDDETGFRPAERSEINDDSVDKHYLDPWGQPYIYRPNKGKKPQPWMRNPRTCDIYSVGEDGVDQTILGGDEENDDIGNW